MDDLVAEFSGHLFEKADFLSWDEGGGTKGATKRTTRIG
jgi:hypothetical protein